MPDQGSSYGAGEDIRYHESQGEMLARMEVEQGGTDDADLLKSEERGEHILPKDAQLHLRREPSGGAGGGQLGD